MADETTTTETEEVMVPCAELNVRRVKEEPKVLEASTIYLMKSPRDGMLDITVTGNDPKNDVIRNQGFNEERIQHLINVQVTQLTRVSIFPNIAARDEAIDTLTTDKLVFVLDASADPNVEAAPVEGGEEGELVPTGAIYLFVASSDTFIKLFDWNDMSMSMHWTNILGAPKSTAAMIDAAVAATIANTKKLNDFGEDENGHLLYKGKCVNNVIFHRPEW